MRPMLDDGQLELAEYYDFTQSYSKEERGAGAVSGKSAFVDGEEGELVLPNGARLGHRSLHKFYQQKHKSENTRITVCVGGKLLLNWGAMLLN